MPTESTDLRISEVASRTGFTTPTIRYYEEIGVLPAPARTGTGAYRSYTERDVARLQFIAGAKHLGCTLDEIKLLVDAWNEDACGPVQHRLRSLVGEKLQQSQATITDLLAFTSELQATATRLAGQPVDGPCDDLCACVASRDDATTGPVAVALSPSASSSPPIVCTLGAGDMRNRLEDWQTALATVTERLPIEGGVRLMLSADTSIEEVARLAVAEQACCSFFTFRLVVDSRGVALEVSAPPDGAPVLAAAFGSAA